MRHFQNDVSPTLLGVHVQSEMYGLSAVINTYCVFGSGTTREIIIFASIVFLIFFFVSHLHAET